MRGSQSYFTARDIDTRRNEFHTTPDTHHTGFRDDDIMEICDACRNLSVFLS